ncbi:DUF551 domain-containing protein [Salmonella enterica]|nr:DUF551 domain-containing protein [Salmonella enterica]
MTTNNHPANGHVSLDRLHQISKILSKASAQSDGGNLGYAMADAVKVIDGVLEARNAEPVEFLPDNLDRALTILGVALPISKEEFNLDAERWMQRLINRVIRLESELIPPAPLVPTFDEWLELRGNKPLGWVKDAMRESYDASRAAMLQAGNHTEQRLDMVEHSGDANENVDCRLPFDQWLSQQNEQIDVDCGCVTTEAFYHWLRVAYEAGNSPESPDGWVPVSDRMPERDVDVQVYCADKKEQMVAYMERNEAEGWFRFASLPNGGGVYCNPTHWMPLPAAPQQEVK